MITRFRDRLGPLALGAGLIGGAIGGCATTPTDDAGRAPATAVVVNQTQQDVRIYALRGAARDLLGLVTANATERFVLAPDMIGSGTIRFHADPVGSTRVFESESVIARPGTTVEWTLRTPLRSSTLRLR